MASTLEPNKTKIAKRVIEVFEFFDQYGQRATVTDIVRRYGRPQSSTSELLSSLVEMGLLYKDPQSRYYSPTPRLASLGISSQPDMIRDGLFTFMHRLSQTTRKSVALFGMIGTHIQIFRLSPGIGQDTPAINCNASDQLLASTAGHLLISTLPQEQAGRLLWRLYAEAPKSTAINQAKIRENITLYRRQGNAVGKAGFVAGLHVAATILPRSASERPLALGVLYTPDAATDTKTYITAMNNGITDLAERNEASFAPPRSAPFRMAG